MKKDEKNALIVLVGPSAIGKTYWSDYLLKISKGMLKRVKTTTTRPPRNEADNLSYDFISRKEFEKGIKNGKFFEYDEYLEHYYGSSLKNIKTILKNACGIFALTPKGVKALRAYRKEIPAVILLLTPITEKVLIRNYMRRGIFDDKKQKELLKKSKKFKLPEKIPHIIVPITGLQGDGITIAAAVLSGMLELYPQLNV
ncbi:MAG: hypothetical protein AAB454_02185 [Patescibacteria group bacterium]